MPPMAATPSMKGPMISIVMLVKDRPRLTKQALESLAENTHGPFNLTIVDDHSSDETKQIVLDWTQAHFGLPARFGRAPEHLGPGRARNEGIRLSEHLFGRPGLLYLCDNDMYATPGWDIALLAAWPFAASVGFKAIGGCCHSYQRPIGQFCDMAGHSASEVAALGLLSWLMAWETWDALGSFEPSTTINGSEDWLMSQKIRQAGGMVGVIDPMVVINCGATSSDGKPCPGAATLWEQAIPPGVVIE